MKDDLSNTIEILTARVRTKEEEANRLKRIINELCAEEGIEPRFPTIVDGGASSSVIRSDEYYGQTLTAAIRNYLERRKNAGLSAASLAEIFNAIKEGGYKFDTRNEENAKISVGNALRKTSSIFHRLPNGEYGLLSWYPNAKAKPEGEAPTKPKDSAETARSDRESSPNAVTNGDIREVILSQDGQFQSSGIEAAIRAKFPSKELSKTKISTVIFILKSKGLLKEITPKAGSRPAVYVKA
jgi:hypothetical protein